MKCIDILRNRDQPAPPVIAGVERKLVLLRHAPLRDVETGKEPAATSNFKVYWEGSRQQGSLYFGIRCEEPDANKLTNLTNPITDISRLWYGDNVELLIETQSHSYYQIAIAPDGTIVDIDRQRGLDERWKSGVDVAIYKGDDF